MQTVAFIVFAVFSVLIWSESIKRFLDSKYSSYSLIIAVGLKTVLIYELMLVFNYTVVQIIIYLASIGLLLKFRLYQQKNFITLFTQNKLFLFFVFFWLVVTFQGKVIYNDEFFWASFVKHLYLFDHYWSAENFLVNGHYLPGIPLWQRFFVGTEFINEQAPLFALGLISAAGFNVLLDANKNQKKVLLFFLCSVAIYNFSPIGISSIYVDTTVGLIFGICLYAIYDFEGENIFVPISLIVFFGLVKDTAFLLSLLCIFILALKLIRLRIRSTSQIIFLAIGVAIIFLNYFLWQRHLNAAGLHSVSHAQDLIKQDLIQISARTKENWALFLNATTTRAFPVSKYLFIHGNLILTFMFFAAFFVYMRKKYEFLIGYVLGFIGYTVAILTFWFYITVEYEGKILASYERYFGTYFVGIALFTIKIIFDQGLWSKKYFRYPFLVLCLVFFPAPQMFYPSSFKKLIPTVLVQKLNLNITFDREAVVPIDTLVLENTPPQSRLWFIWNKRGGYEMLVARYELAPRQFVVQDYIVGDPIDDNDVWTKKLTVEQFMNHAKSVDYVVLGLIDDNFVKNYQSVFVYPPKSPAIYEKISTPEGIKLSEILYKDNK